MRYLAAACLLGLAACGERKAAPPTFPVPSQMTLYSIQADQVPHSERAYQAMDIEGLPLLGKTKISDPQVRQRIIAALNQAVTATTVESCFNPRHGLRAIEGSSVTDYIICFECSIIHVIADGKLTAYAINGSAQEILNKLLRAANVPLNPSR